MKLKDWQKSCVGFLLIFIAFGAGVLAWAGGFIGKDFQTGTIVGFGAFMFFFVLAGYFFLKIEDWALLPAVAAGIYAVLPDIIIGQVDDVAAVVVGALLSALLAWRKQKSEKEKLAANVNTTDSLKLDD